MKTKLRGQILLILFSFVIYGRAASALPEYVLTDVSFFNKTLASDPNFQYAGVFSSDSFYVKIIDRNLELPASISIHLQPIRAAQKINFQWRTNDSFQFINVSCFNEADLIQLEQAFRIHRPTVYRCPPPRTTVRSPSRWFRTVRIPRPG